MTNSFESCDNNSSSERRRNATIIQLDGEDNQKINRKLRKETEDNEEYQCYRGKPTLGKE
jgi:hypothetical protein